MEIYITPYRNIKYIDHGLVHKAQLINYYHTMRSLDSTRNNIYAFCVDQLESKLCTLYWSTLYLFFPVDYDGCLEGKHQCRIIFIISRHARHSFNSLMTILRVTPWTSPWLSLELLHASITNSWDTQWIFLFDCMVQGLIKHVSTHVPLWPQVRSISWILFF